MKMLGKVIKMQGASWKSVTGSQLLATVMLRTLGFRSWSRTRTSPSEAIQVGHRKAIRPAPNLFADILFVQYVLLNVILPDVFH